MARTCKKESHFGSATAVGVVAVAAGGDKEEYVNFKVNRASLKWKLHLKLNRKNRMGWKRAAGASDEKKMQF